MEPAIPPSASAQLSATRRVSFPPHPSSGFWAQPSAVIRSRPRGRILPPFHAGARTTPLEAPHRTSSFADLFYPTTAAPNPSRGPISVRLAVRSSNAAASRPETTCEPNTARRRTSAGNRIQSRPRNRVGDAHAERVATEPFLITIARRLARVHNPCPGLRLIFSFRSVWFCSWSPSCLSAPMPSTTPSPSSSPPPSQASGFPAGSQFPGGQNGQNGQQSPSGAPLTSSASLYCTCAPTL